MVEGVTTPPEQAHNGQDETFLSVFYIYTWHHRPTAGVVPLRTENVWVRIPLVLPDL